MYTVVVLGVILCVGTQGLVVFSGATSEIKALVYSWGQMCN